MICPNCGGESMSAQVCSHCAAPFDLAANLPLDDDASFHEGAPVPMPMPMSAPVPVPVPVPVPGSPSGSLRTVTNASYDAELAYGPPAYTPDGVFRVYGASSPSGALPPVAGAPQGQGFTTPEDLSTQELPVVPSSSFSSAPPPSPLSSSSSSSAPSTPSASPPSPFTGHLIVHPSANQWSGSAERIVPLDGRDITIGRSSTCTIAIEDDDLVSRLHAIIRAQDDSYVLADLASSNGTLVNGEPLTAERTLHEGDRMRIGNCEIIYSTAPAPASALATVAPSGPTSAPADEIEMDVSTVQTYPPATAPAPVSLARAEVPTAAPPARTLDALQAQLTDMVGQLRQQAEAAARDVERLTTAVASVSTTIAMLVQAERQHAQEGPDLAALIELTERTAQNPRHLDNVIELTEHAAAIATALHALQAIHSNTGLLEAVDTLRAHLTAAVLGPNPSPSS